MQRSYPSDSNRRPNIGVPSESHHSNRTPKKTKRPRCKICKEPFDTLLFAVSVRQGKAHPVCAALKAIGLEKLATTSGR